MERIFFNGGDEAFYHICTDGASLDWMFRDDRDFIAGVNRSGICTFLSGAKQMSFVLMDNHVHFVLRGTMPSCKEYISKFKNLTGKYISSRYGVVGHIHTLPTQIIKIDTPDRLLATLAYLDRNPIVAGWRRMPDEYPWGVSRFVFRTPARYLYFLSKKLEGEMDNYFSFGTLTFLPDKELRVIVGKLALELFGEADLRMLSINSRLMLARKLRYEYASSVKQISRMLHLDAEMLKGFI